MAGALYHSTLYSRATYAGGEAAPPRPAGSAAYLLLGRNSLAAAPSSCLCPTPPAPGNLIRLQASIYLENSLADPPNLTALVRSPDGSFSRYDYGPDLSLVRDSAGSYHLDIPTPQEGTYSWRWEISDSIGAGEGEFEIASSPFFFNGDGNPQPPSGNYVSSFNGREGNVTLTASDITTALGYSPLSRAGDTMTGPLTLPGPPTAQLHAATRQFVLDTVGAGGAPGPAFADTVLASSFVTLEAAISSIGTATKTLVMDAQLSVSQAVTIPGSCGLLWLRAGQWTDAGGTVTFTGRTASFLNLPSHQIFSGFSPGDITWTGAYPIYLLPVWWGANADNNTDCWPAIQSAISAQEHYNSSTGYKGGGWVILNAINTSNYYTISQTIEVDRPTRFTGGGAGGWSRNTTILNATPVHTFLFLKDASGSILENLTIVGSRYSTGHSTHVFSANGTLTLQRVSGPPLSGPNEFHAIKFNEYILPIDPDQFSADQIVVDSNWSRPFEVRQGTLVRFDETDMRFADNALVGVVISWASANYTVTWNDRYSLHLSPPIPDPDGTTNYAGLVSLPAGNHQILPCRYHGVQTRSNITCRDVAVFDCDGDGFLSEGYDSTSAGDAHFIDCNLFEKIWAENNSGWGIVAHGVDSNVQCYLNLSIVNNVTGGIYQASQHGNTYFNIHFRYNTRYDLYCKSEIANNTFIGIYKEGLITRDSYGESKVIVMGGEGSEIVRKYNGAGIWNAVGGMEVGNFIDLRTSYGGRGSYDGMVRLGDAWSGKRLLGLGPQDDPYNIANGQTTVPPLNLVFDTPYPGWLNMGYGSGSETVAFALSTGFASEGGGRFWLPDLLFLGPQKQRQIASSSAPNGAGLGYGVKGDIYWHQTASGVTLYYKTTDSGNTGWVPYDSSRYLSKGLTDAVSSPLFELTGLAAGQGYSATVELSVYCWTESAAQVASGTYRIDAAGTTSGTPISQLSTVSAGPALVGAGSLVVTPSLANGASKVTFSVVADSTGITGAGYIVAYYTVRPLAGATAVNYL
jgi:hypothetical protein